MTHLNALCFKVISGENSFYVWQLLRQCRNLKTMRSWLNIEKNMVKWKEYRKRFQIEFLKGTEILEMNAGTLATSSGVTISPAQSLSPRLVYMQFVSKFCQLISIFMWYVSHLWCFWNSFMRKLIGLHLHLIS